MTAPAMHEEDALGKAYDGRLMRRLLGYVRPYSGLVVGAIALLFFEGALQLVGPWLTKQVIDVAIPARDTGMIRNAVLIFAIALGAQFAANYGETLLTALLGQRVMRDLRLELFAHLQRLPISFFDRNPVGRLVTRVTSDVEALNELFTAGVVAGLGDLFTLLAISVMMLIVDWRLAVASFLVIPFVLLVSGYFRVRMRVAYREIRTRLARINAFLQERLTGMRVVQLFGRERAEAERFDTLNRDHLQAHLRSITVYALYFPAIEILTTVALASLVVAGAGRVEVGTLTIGTVAAFLQLLRRFFEPLQDLSDKYNTLQQAMASSERIFALLDTPAPDTPAADSTTVRHPARHGVTVAFENVWFRYDTGHVAAPPTDAGFVEPTGSREYASRATPAALPTDAGFVEPTGSREYASRETPAALPTDAGFVEPTGSREYASRARPAALPTDAGFVEPTPEEWVLRNVSFVARPGQTIALVGHTGAGKTTVISLLMRFYEPQLGRITMDGVDIREIPVGELRARIGYVQQDIFLFAGDVASNIRLALPLTDDEVAEAARRVGADRIIRRFPGGYAHELGERGASISVGERQLLAFARAIAADAGLLLLDEATSAVDSEIEAEIQRALAVLMRGRTTIVVAHRLSTIVSADEIIVMHHGEIRERGTHRSLLGARGLYERLYRLQAGLAVDAAHAELPLASPPSES